MSVSSRKSKNLSVGKRSMTSMTKNKEPEKNRRPLDELFWEYMLNEKPDDTFQRTKSNQKPRLFGKQQEGMADPADEEQAAWELLYDDMDIMCRAGGSFVSGLFGTKRPQSTTTGDRSRNEPRPSTRDRQAEDQNQTFSPEALTQSGKKFFNQMLEKGLSFESSGNPKEDYDKKLSGDPTGTTKNDDGFIKSLNSEVSNLVQSSGTLIRNVSQKALNGLAGNEEGEEEDILRSLSEDLSEAVHTGRILIKELATGISEHTDTE